MQMLLYLFVSIFINAEERCQAAENVHVAAAALQM